VGSLGSLPGPSPNLGLGSILQDTFVVNLSRDLDSMIRGKPSSVNYSFSEETSPRK
jgi:hypothetical protein